MRVVLIMTETLDGFIARDAGDDSAWVEKYDALFFDTATRTIGTVILGANTYKLLGKPFEDRLNIVMTATPNPEATIPNTLEFYGGEPRALLAELEARGIHEVALIGGSQINASFLFEKLVTEIFVTVAPKLFGQGLSLASGYELDTELRLVEARPLGEDAVLLRYTVV